MEDVLYWLILYTLIGFAFGTGMCCEENRHNPCEPNLPGSWIDPKLLLLAGGLWPLVAIGLVVGMILGREHGRHRRPPQV